jgi:hypothetical protein
LGKNSSKLIVARLWLLMVYRLGKSWQASGTRLLGIALINDDTIVESAVVLNGANMGLWRKIIG